MVKHQEVIGYYISDYMSYTVWKTKWEDGRVTYSKTWHDDDGRAHTSPDYTSPPAITMTQAEALERTKHLYPPTATTTPDAPLP